MSVWEAREAAFEKGLEIDFALRFKSLARRNKLLGLWVAEKLGLSGSDSEVYALRLVEDEVGHDDDAALAAKIDAALSGVSPPISAHRIRRRIAEMTAIAAQQVFEGR